MQSEVRSIPPAPRRIRLRPLIAHRWPLLALGAALVVLGGLVAWAMFLQSGGKFSFGPRLDRGPKRVVNAEVTEVYGERRFDGSTWDDVRYRFSVRSDGQETTVHGMCFAPAGRYAVGDTAPVEVLESDRNVNCILDGVLHIYRSWLYAQFWIVVMVVPGALILLAWLAGVLQLRQVLVHGDVSVGRVLSTRPARWILPEMLWVAYEFRDHRARLRKNRHWVRARGALGGRLLAGGAGERDEALPVLHDRRLPHWNRLLLPQDFLRDPASERDDATGGGRPSVG